MRWFVLACITAIGAAHADETCNSPYISQLIKGQEDYVYVWTLGVEGLGDGSDKLVTIDVNPKSKRYGKVISKVSTGARVEAHHMILAKAGGPRRSQHQHVLAHALTCLELGTMALLVVEGDRLHASEALERPGKTDGRVLTSGEQDEGAVRVH